MTDKDDALDPSDVRLCAAECEMLGQDHAAAMLERCADALAALTAELEGCTIAHRAAGDDALRLTRERNEARQLFEDADARATKAEERVKELEAQLERRP